MVVLFLLYEIINLCSCVFSAEVTNFKNGPDFFLEIELELLILSTILELNSDFTASFESVLAMIIEIFSKEVVNTSIWKSLVLLAFKSK